jgi:hypothetical protein
MYDGGSTSTSIFGGPGGPRLSGFSASANFAVVGSSSNDSMNLNVRRSSSDTDDYIAGNMTIAMGDGNDSLVSARWISGDSVDMGAGDDVVGTL